MSSPKTASNANTPIASRFAQSSAFTKAPTFLSFTLTNAFFNEDHLPKDKQHFLEINEELSQVWPQITNQKDPMQDAGKWDGVEGKLEHLIKTAPES